MYHFGIAIKQAREHNHMSQRELADRWPRADGGTGCTQQYLHMVECGQRTITDQQTLRGLCVILGIPTWRFGLSEFDPFNPAAPQGSLVLEVVEHWVYRTEQLYRTAPLPEVANDVAYLRKMFEHFRKDYPPTFSEQKQFLTLYAQVQNLDGIIHLGYGRYGHALTTFRSMYETAQELSTLTNDPTMLCHALLTVGTELERLKDPKAAQEAVEHLEYARDLSLDSSKNVTAYMCAYLARTYASVGDKLRFERAIELSQKLASQVNYGDGTDFIYHPKSGILAEKSHGYLELGEPEKALALREEIEEQITLDKNARLDAWIPLDWARAKLAAGEVEEATQEAGLFYDRSRALYMPHAVGRAVEFIGKLPDTGETRELKERVEAL